MNSSPPLTPALLLAHGLKGFAGGSFPKCKDSKVHIEAANLADLGLDQGIMQPDLGACNFPHNPPAEVTALSEFFMQLVMKAMGSMKSCTCGGAATRG